MTPVYILNLSDSGLRDGFQILHQISGLCHFRRVAGLALVSSQYFSSHRPLSVFSHYKSERTSIRTNASSCNSLAYAEIYITLLTLFTKFDLQLYETSSKDMEWKDRGVPFTNGHLKVIATRREN